MTGLGFGEGGLRNWELALDWKLFESRAKSVIRCPNKPYYKEGYDEVKLWLLKKLQSLILVGGSSGILWVA